MKCLAKRCHASFSKNVFAGLPNKLNFQETLDNVLANDYSLDEPEFDDISDAAKEFIAELLVSDPRGR